MPTRRSALAAAAALALAAGARGAGAQPRPGGEAFPVSRLEVRTRDGRTLPFRVELALTPAQQAQGLMFRTSMADDAGMLFLNPVEREVSFWMMNTLIPLDMVFIDRTGTIVRIHENAVPHDTTPIPSGQPVLGILEVNGGLARRLGIDVGDRVVHEAFRPR